MSRYPPITHTAQIMAEPTRVRVLDEPVSAKSVGLSLVQMRRLRRAGLGPVHVRLGCKRIGYRPEDLDDWLAAQAVAADTGSG